MLCFWITNTFPEEFIIGVLLRVLNDSLVEVALPVSTGMVIMKVEKDTVYFVVNGASARRTQFPLQNAFSLTVHKTQGLTLPHATVSLDASMFACGQTYVAMSKATSWQNLDIMYFDINSIKADKNVIKEYCKKIELGYRRISLMFKSLLDWSQTTYVNSVN